jgi:hypothetical protein
METNCISYGDCNFNSMECDSSCKYKDLSCFDCVDREGEECGVDGHEIYEDSIPCRSFERKVA